MSTCNCRLTVVSLGSWPTDYAQNKNFLGSERRKKNGSPIVLEESIEYTSDEKKKPNWKMWTCNQPGWI